MASLAPFLRSLYLDASAVSAFSGRHRYKSQSETFCDVLRRNPSLLAHVEETLDTEDLSYRPLLDHLGITVPPDTTPTTLALDILAEESLRGKAARDKMKEATTPTRDDIANLRLKRPRTEDVVRQVTSTLCGLAEHKAVVGSMTLSEDVVRKCEDAVRHVVCSPTSSGAPLSPDSQQRLHGLVQGTSIKHRGNELERDALQRLIKQENLLLIREQEPVRVSMEVDGVNVLVCGRIDAICRDIQDRVLVVEMKNRKNRFFVPSYDLDQLSIYVMASQHPRGVLVEQCQGSLRVSHTMTLDEATSRWASDIVPDLKRAVLLFAQALVNPRRDRMWDGLRLTTAPRPS